MDFQDGQGDFIRPESSLDFYPLHQPQTEVNCGKIQTLAANSERFLSLVGVGRIVNHPGKLKPTSTKSKFGKFQLYFSFFCIESSEPKELINLP